ncbi:hypothetical protein DF052_27580 [Burkholderia glumae]|nr:hypothetical protein DF052_27580 [Burkholderia glumae]UVS99037.1 hypothetical protein EFP19_25875 [Burkholderia glumae]
MPVKELRHQHGFPKRATPCLLPKDAPTHDRGSGRDQERTLDATSLHHQQATGKTGCPDRHANLSV